MKRSMHRFVLLFSLLLSAFGLLALTDVFLIKGVSNLFRSQHLLTGSKFSFKLFLRELARR